MKKLLLIMALVITPIVKSIDQPEKLRVNLLNTTKIPLPVFGTPEHGEDRNYGIMLTRGTNTQFKLLPNIKFPLRPAISPLSIGTPNGIHTFYITKKDGIVHIHEAPGKTDKKKLLSYKEFTAPFAMRIEITIIEGKVTTRLHEREGFRKPWKLIPPNQTKPQK